MTLDKWQGYKVTPRDRGREMVLHDYVVRRDEIPSYFNEENTRRIEFYYRYKAFGWPYAGGWAEQPAHLVDIVELLEGEMGKRVKK